MIAAAVIIGIVLLGFIGITGCYIFITRHARAYIYDQAGDIPFRETALILGTARLTHHGGINRYFQDRMTAATELFREKKCRTLIVSGADRRHNHLREADEMKKALIEMGIPADVIITDRAGYRTWDSLWRCRGSFGAHTITVVSQRFHIERAIFLGHRQGLNIIGFTAKNVNGKIGTRMLLRECLARVKGLLDSYLLHPRPIYMRRLGGRRRRR